MKTILTTLAIILISLSANALEPTPIRLGYTADQNVIARTICVSGYVFVVVKSQGANGVSITQMWETVPGYRSENRPKKCKK
jgi:hypothetical protein